MGFRVLPDSNKRDPSMKMCTLLSRVILSTLLLFVSAIGFAAEKEIIRVTGLGADPRYNYEDANGNRVGFIPELTKAIMHEAKLDYRFLDRAKVPIFRNNTAETMDSILHDADLYMLGIVTFEKRQKFYYSIPYLSLDFTVLTRRGIYYSTMADLVDKRILVIDTSAGKAKMEILSKQNGLKFTPIIAPDITQALGMLKQGEADYLVICDRMLAFHIKKIKEAGVRVNYANIPRLQFAVASLDRALIHKVNTSIRKLINSGELEQIINDTLIKSDLSQQFYWLKHIIITLAVLLVILLIIIIIGKRRISGNIKDKKYLNKVLQRTIESGQMVIWQYQAKKNNVTVTYANNYNLSPSYSRDEALNNIHPHDKQAITDGMKAIREGMKQKEIVIRIKGEHDDESYHWEHITLNREEDPKTGTYLGTIGIQRNIDNVIQTRTALEQERKLLRIIAEQAPMSILIKDPETRTVYYHNRAALKHLGVTDTETIEVIEPYIMEDTRERAFHRDFELLENHETMEYLQKVKLKDGTEKHFYTKRNIIKIDNKEYIMVSNIDNDEQIQRENAKKLLDLSTPILKCFTWSYNMRTNYFSHISGYKPDNYFLDSGGSLFDKNRFVIEEDRGRYETYFNELLKMGEGEKSLQFRSKIIDGVSAEWWEVHTKAEQKEDDQGRYTVLYGLSMNIHERKLEELAHAELMQDLKEAKLKAEESERLKSQFLANMSHEIRTPLNAIVGFASLIPQEENKEKAEQFANIIQTNSDLLLKIINDILDLSRIEAGIAYHMEKVDIATHFQTFAEGFGYKIDPTNINFIIENPYHHLFVEIDKERFSQVMVNFLSNAIKHTTKGYIKVGYTFDEQTDMLELYVEGSGRGIPKDKQHLVFNRFEKIDQFSQGTGLGLSIVAAMMESIGGECGFESTEGVGSRFYTRRKVEKESTLTEKKVDGLAIEDTSLGNNEDNGKDRGVDNLHILIAEDTLNNFQFLKYILSKNRITHVINGIEAVDALKNNENTFDLVLMDIRMPEMDGLEATREIRKFNPSIPIIAVTANAFAEDRTKALEAGCNNFVSKPVNKQELMEKIHDVMGK